MAKLRIPYKTIDGIEVPTDIYIPSNQQYELAPVIIIIHGGGFILGSSKMNNADQIQDCLDRGWIVLSVDHRLCPGVNVLEGPMADVKDALHWAQSGGLNKALLEASVDVQLDPKRVMVMGTSAGGHLALTLAWTCPTPPLAILDFYGAKHFRSDFWLQPVPQLKAILPPAPPDETFSHLYNEKYVLEGGMSLEGQSNGQQGPNLKDPRVAFAMNAIANGHVLNVIWPSFPEGLEKIDPVLNVHSSWPPTCIVHGTADFMIPPYLSRHLESELKSAGVETEFIEVEGEPHTFVGRMQKGSKTWETQRRGFDFLESILRRSYNQGEKVVSCGKSDRNMGKQTIITATFAILKTSTTISKVTGLRLPLKQ